MPLTVNNGTALNPQAPAAPEEIHMVNIQHRAQEGRLWCWAACVQMVLEHNHLEISQCDIVRKKLENEHHACPEDRNLRNESCEALQMAKTWRKFKMHVVPRDWEINMAKIKEEIEADRAIQVGILWDEDEGGGGHAVLIKGWRPTSPEALLIDDPLRESLLGTSKFGSGQATHEELIDAFGHGIWRYTWTDLHKEQ